jgi:pantothenate kinase
VAAIKAGNKVMKPIYNHITGMLDEAEEITPTDIVIFEGLHPMLDEKVRVGARKRDARASATHATRNPATTRLSLRARARGSEIARAATATRHNAAHAATAYGNHLAPNTARPRERGSTRASKPESCALAG